MAQRRTQDELRNEDFNYFIYFMIPLSETDKAKIENQIKSRASKTDGSILQRRMLELKNDAIEIMCNDSVFDETTNAYVAGKGGRAKEAAAAKQFKLNSIVSDFNKICKTKKTHFKSDIVDMIKTCNKELTWFDENEFFAEIDDLLKDRNLGIKVIDNCDNRIPFNDYKAFEKKIENGGSLYDFLGAKKDDPVDVIRTKISEKNSEYSKKKDLKDKQYGAEMCSSANKLLCLSPESKKNYDDYITLKEKVWDELEIRKNRGIKEIQLSEYEEYVKRIMDKLGCKIDDAEALFAIGCKFFTMILVGTSEGNNLEECPYEDCGKLYVRGEKNCPHCGKPLEIVCWNCGGKMPFTEKNKTCPTCHSTIQSKNLFDLRIADIEKVARQPACEIIDLKSALANLINAVPEYKTCPNGYAAKKIAEYEKVIGEKIKEEETTGANYRNEIKKIQALINSKNYLQAQSAALNVQKTFGTYNSANTKALISDIEKVTNQALAHVQKAKTYVAQNNEEMVVSCVAQALDICADYNEAKIILQKFPPKAPKSIRSSVTPTNIARIEWDKSESKNMTTYTVVKKVGSKPQSATDGTVLDSNLTINFYEDSNIVSATPYYYAVFAERCGIKSAVTVTASPIMIYLDVDEVHQNITEDKISVEWNCPHNVKAIEVWKKEGPIAPNAPGDGTRVPTDGLNGFNDSQCKQENSYLIVCLYESSGVKKYSRGVQRTLKKYESLKQIDNPQITQSPTGEFVFTCENNSNQKIKMICSKEKLSCRVDTVIQMMEFNNLCKGCVTLNHHFDLNQNVEFSIPVGELVWVYPMVYNEQLFMLSSPFLLNNILGIKNMSYTEEQGTILIKGILHQEAKNVIVLISDKDFPHSIDEPGEKFIIPKDRFSAEGGASVKLKTNTINYISVFVELEKSGVKAVSKPVFLGNAPIDYREKVVVYHALSYKISPKNRFTVTIEFSSNVPIELPKLCLVKGCPRPMTKNAGELVENINPITLTKGWLSKKYTSKVKIESEGCPLNTKFVLFLQDESVKYVQLKEVKSI